MFHYVSFLTRIVLSRINDILGTNRQWILSMSMFNFVFLTFNIPKHSWVPGQLMPVPVINLKKSTVVFFKRVLVSKFFGYNLTIWIGSYRITSLFSPLSIIIRLNSFLSNVYYFYFCYVSNYTRIEQIFAIYFYFIFDNNFINWWFTHFSTKKQQQQQYIDTIDSDRICHGFLNYSYIHYIQSIVLSNVLSSFKVIDFSSSPLSQHLFTQNYSLSFIIIVKVNNW